MTKKWILKKAIFPDPIAQILFNRGIKAKKDQERFLEPRYERDLIDPFLMRGMKEAVARIKKALAAHEKIGIFGDYDVDGVCGSIILYEFLERFGATPFFETYLPDRQQDGYGLNMHGLSYFKKQGVTLVITVDCGITDHKEIAWAGEQGMDVIVTDHHEVSQGLPPAKVVLNPKQKNDTYPFSKLAGTGVAFKLAQALRKEMNHERLSESWEKWLLDLVAFATVADQMDLVSENRVLVKYGLLVFAKTRRVGLRELIRAARIDQDRITTQDLLYQLAPRVNAASRIDHALKAFKLLVSKDVKEARALAEEIDRSNKKRQALVAKALKEVDEQIQRNFPAIKKDSFILEGSKNWPAGVCGLVANKILDRYGYPTFIYSEGDKMVKGSARSYPPFSVVAVMKGASSSLLDWGGHHQAGGFSLLPSKLALFKRSIRRETAKLKGKKITPSLTIDLALKPEDITLDLWDRLQKLEPFGKGNPEPLFLLEGVTVQTARKVGAAQDHFKLALTKNGRFFNAIYFRGVADNLLLKEGDTADIVFHLKRSTWGVSTQPELHVIDLKRKA